MKAKIDLEKFICSYVKYNNIQDALKDQGLKCCNDEIVEISQESDDKIKKDIVAAVETYGDFTQHRKEEIYAWLKKQNETPMDVMDIEKQYDIDVLEKHITKDSISELAHTVIVRNGWEIVDAKEQKPIEKKELKKIVVPIFNIGDTIIDKDFYECGTETIKDIKDGQYIFTDGYSINIDEQEGWQLVKASANIERNSTEWSEEDEGFLNLLLAIFKVEHPNGIFSTGNITVFNGDSVTSNRIIDWIKSIKDRAQSKFTKWTEEDERIKNHVLQIIKKYWNSLPDTDYDENEISESCYNWIESFKGYIQPHSKQEWTEEDERIYQSIIDDTVQENQLDDKQINWLKLLKQRYGWKPSKEQIIALRWVLNNIPYNKHKEEISGLLDQIKNL